MEQTNVPPATPAPPGPPPKKRGCLLAGCITVLVLALGILITAVIGLKYAKKMVTDFTEPTPASLPQTQMPRADLQKLQDRVDKFREDVRALRPAGTLSLTPEELNALIDTDQDMQGLRGHVYITGIEDGKIKGKLSIPLDAAGLQAFKGRFLNGDGIFTLLLKNGLLRLTVENISVKGTPVPEVYMNQLRKYNLARDINNNPRASAAMDRLESIEVKDGHLIITPKSGS